jgi:hypothetical protein
MLMDGHLGKESMSRFRRVVAALFAVAALGVVVAPVATANSSPPTEGGNGGGKSGQCTGKPSERPAVCPAT